MKSKVKYGIAVLAIVALLGAGFAAAMGNGFMNSALNDGEKALMQEQNQAIKDAIKNSDYATWKSLMEQRIEMMKSQLTEENFNAITQKHQEMSEFKEQFKAASDAGDYDKMQQLREQYGFPSKKAMKNGLGLGNRHSIE